MQLLFNVIWTWNAVDTGVRLELEKANVLVTLGIGHKDTD